MEFASERPQAHELGNEAKADGKYLLDHWSTSDVERIYDETITKLGGGARWKSLPCSVREEIVNDVEARLNDSHDLREAKAIMNNAIGNAIEEILERR